MKKKTEEQISTAKQRIQKLTAEKCDLLRRVQLLKRTIEQMKKQNKSEI
jgi:hypothetical protein